jgi:GNAT superfamily N-acetyltransferase
MLIRQLAQSDHLAEFNSNAVIDGWLKFNAKPFQVQQRAQTYLGFHQNQLVGFYSAQVFDGEQSINSILLIKLAVDARYQGQGFGAELLHHAIGTAKQVSALVGCRGIVTYAKDSAIRFYAKHGFELIDRTSNAMFLKIVL